MKKLVLFLLVILFATGIQAQNEKKVNKLKRMGRFEYVQKVRSQIFRTTTGDSIYAPSRMGRVGYKQRMRSEIILSSETADSVKLFAGILKNSKLGINQKATFVIKSTIVKDLPYCFSLEPEEKIKVYLPAGEYTMEICCGTYYRKSVFHVDPRRKHYFCGEYVYFGAEKNLSDL